MVQCPALYQSIRFVHKAGSTIHCNWFFIRNISVQQILIISFSLPYLLPVPVHPPSSNYFFLLSLKKRPRKSQRDPPKSKQTIAKNKIIIQNKQSRKLYIILLHGRKLVFPFSVGWYQLQTTAWLGVETWVHFFLSMLGSFLVWNCTGLVWVVSVCSCLHPSCCV